MLPQPPFDNAAMDGFAYRHADIALAADTGLLLVGWLGFNAGSAGAADALAATAAFNTILAAAAAAVGWTAVEWIERKRPTLLGLLSGIVGGLVAITPACGALSPIGSIILGLIAGAIAKLILPGKQGGGWLITLLLGVVGAIVGGLLGNMLFNVDIGGFFELRTWLLAIGGSIVVLLIYGLIVGKKKA